MNLFDRLVAYAFFGIIAFCIISAMLWSELGRVLADAAKWCRAARTANHGGWAFALLAAAVLVPMLGAHAFAQTTFAANAATSVDLSPLINALIGLAAAIVTLGIPMVIARFKANGVLKNAQLADALQTAALSAAQYGINTVQQSLAGKPVTVDLKNQVIAKAAGYLVQHVPEAVEKSGKTDDEIAQFILARLDLSGGTISLTGQPAAPAIPAVAQ